MRVRVVNTENNATGDFVAGATAGLIWILFYSVFAGNASTTIVRISRGRSRFYRLDVIRPLKSSSSNCYWYGYGVFSWSIKIKKKRKPNENNFPGNSPNYNRVITVWHVLCKLYTFTRVYVCAYTHILARARCSDMQVSNRFGAYAVSRFLFRALRTTGKELFSKFARERHTNSNEICEL